MSNDENQCTKEEWGCHFEKNFGKTATIISHVILLLCVLFLLCVGGNVV